MHKLIFISLLIASCGQPPKPIPSPLKIDTSILRDHDSVVATEGASIFHVKVKLWECSPNGPIYCVLATNNDWQDSIELLDCLDLTASGDKEIQFKGGVDIVVQVKLFQKFFGHGKAEAVAFARQFKTYNQCLAYNESMEREKERLLRYYRKHPPVIYTDADFAVPKCDCIPIQVR